MSDLTQLTVKQCLSALEKNEISSRELTTAFLKRIESFESSIHAFITLTPEKALTSADAADKQRRESRGSGAALPPLLGLPLQFRCIRSRRTWAGETRAIAASSWEKTNWVPGGRWFASRRRYRLRRPMAWGCTMVASCWAFGAALYCDLCNAVKRFTVWSVTSSGASAKCKKLQK